MKPQQIVLLAALAAGILAVAAGLMGLSRVAGASAAVMLVLFVLAPWMHQRSSS